LAEQLAGAGLIIPGFFVQSKYPDCLQDPQGAKRIDVGGVFGAVKTHRNMALRRQIVDLVGLDFLDDADKVAGIGEIAVMEAETEVFCVWILIEVINALCVLKELALRLMP